MKSLARTAWIKTALHVIQHMIECMTEGEASQSSGGSASLRHRYEGEALPGKARMTYVAVHTYHSLNSRNFKNVRCFIKILIQMRLKEDR
jgi:hypothetical protein